MDLVYRSSDPVIRLQRTEQGSGRRSSMGDLPQTNERTEGVLVVSTGTNGLAEEVSSEGWGNAKENLEVYLNTSSKTSFGHSVQF